MEPATRTEIEDRLGHRFRHVWLLETAFRHASHAKDSRPHRVDSNQRLEFLGDSVLGLIVAEWLYRGRGMAQEGGLSQVRARYVSEKALAVACRELDIARYLELAHGEEASGGRDRASNLADLFEAVVGAIYLDGGLAAAGHFIEAHLIRCPKVQDAEDEIDSKSALLEAIQAQSPIQPEYEVVDQAGPPHSPIFTVVVTVAGKVFGMGSGGSKQDAERGASAQALARIDEIVALDDVRHGS